MKRLKWNILIQVYMGSMLGRIIKQMEEIGTKMMQGPYGGMVMMIGLLVKLIALEEQQVMLILKAMGPVFPKSQIPIGIFIMEIGLMLVKN